VLPQAGLVQRIRSLVERRGSDHRAARYRAGRNAARAV
jgi:hypothetical protein